jgi:hypothetical protein
MLVRQYSQISDQPEKLLTTQVEHFIRHPWTL